MEQFTITVKTRVLTDTDSKSLLDSTMFTCSSAYSYVADCIFRTHDLKQFSLNKALYSSLRELSGLKLQMVQSVLKTVIARYETILENQNEWIEPNFKHPKYDLVWSRDYSLTNNCLSVDTLRGRIKLPCSPKGTEQYFSSDIYRFGTTKLVNKHEKYLLYVPATYEVEESNLSNICNVVGVGRDINFTVVTYDDKHESGFASGKQVKQKKASYPKLYKELQMRQTPPSRRRLKAISSRENR